MKILIVNPNTTTSMTAEIAAAAHSAAAVGTEIVAVNPMDGPSSIEGHFDEAFSVPGLLAEIRSGEVAGADGHVIACFDDPGLDAARSISQKPVVGIGEAACHMASLVAGRFSVVTTGARSIPAIELNLIKYGLMARCASVRACEIPVLDLANDRERAETLISDQIDAAIRDDRAEAIVLGCAGMATFAAPLSEMHGIPVIDGVGCAVKLIESLHYLGITTSKIGGYRPPAAKAYSGRFAAEAPRHAPLGSQAHGCPAS
ncbi:MAG: aspartate/glutamate racemase family protein [Novosphingobium sp.]